MTAGRTGSPRSLLQILAADKAAEIGPTGSIGVKRVGYSMPYGTRKFDKEPIGSDIEKGGA